MNPFVVPVKCAVCGGEGLATVKAAGSIWFGGILTHQNPRICAEVIKAREEKEKDDIPEFKSDWEMNGATQ